MANVDVLLATYDRSASLAMTLSGLALQTHADWSLTVADQNETPADEQTTIASLVRVIEARGVRVIWHHRPCRHGIAEQRDFLLKQATAPYVCYVDDDVLMEPWVIAELTAAMQREHCGFIGAFPTGLSFRDDVRPGQQCVEFWEGPVQPETVDPDNIAWQRLHLHRAANLYHAASRYAIDQPRLYKVAWVASCVMYDRSKLCDVGGFGFWARLPRYHSGEEVLVQNLLMRRYGGCAIMPSGTYHSQEPSTVLNAAGGIDGHALELLPEMVARYASSRGAHG